VANELRNAPEVKTFTFVDKPAAYREAQTLFATQPDILDSLTVDKMPPSFRVVPTDAELIRTVGDRFEARPGVRNVTFAKEQIKSLLDFTRVLQAGLIIMALVLMVSAALLILNTIRIAIFARRREVAVMKLVGATNWFIRLPFMLEGLLQGLIGAGVAFGAVIGLRAMLGALAREEDFLFVRQLVVTSDQAVGTGLVVMAVGVLVGTLGSMIAVRRFLNT